MSGPLFFVDRSLGRIQVPQLLRADGWTLRTMAEHYGEHAGQRIDDTEWLEVAGANGWPVLAKDEKIRYRPAERAAIIDHGVRAFCLTSGNLRAAEMAACFIASRSAIWERASERGAGLFAVTRTSIHPLDLS